MSVERIEFRGGAADVELRRLEEPYPYAERAYAALVDGRRLGVVYLSRVETSRKAGRLRIVTGHPLRWKYRDEVSVGARHTAWDDRKTRREALTALLRHAVEQGGWKPAKK